MIARLLLVVLVTLNLSAAAWWLFHRDHGASPPAPTNNVPALQLAAAVQPIQAALPADAICVSLGPFADAAASEQARQAIQSLTLRINARQVVQAGNTVFWLDVAAENGFDPTNAGIATGAPHAERVACPATSG